MIVASNRPGPITLSARINNKTVSFTFQPGRNDCPDELFKAIKEQHSDSWDAYYGSILTPFKEVEISLPPDAEVGRADGKMAREGEFESFDVKTCLQMISNCTNRGILTSWQHSERNIGKDRKIVMDAITKQIRLSPQAEEDRLREMRESRYVEERYEADHQGS
jgi:hypothetical protein